MDGCTKLVMGTFMLLNYERFEVGLMSLCFIMSASFDEFMLFKPFICFMLNDLFYRK